MGDRKADEVPATELLSNSSGGAEKTEVIPPSRSATRPLADEPAKTEAVQTDRFKALLSEQKTEAINEQDLPARRRPDLAVGTVLRDRFKILRVLGRGGMGTVYKATDLLKEEAHDRDTSIALKVLKPGIVAADMTFMALQREARRAQQLAHPNIVTVYDFDRADDVIFMTMEFMQGQGLDRVINDGPIDPAEVRRITHEVGRGLAYAHKRGIVHSDLKPENIFLLDDGRVKILDFGIARAWQSEKPDFVEDAIAGCTPAYASPEVMEQKLANPSDDVYALACVVAQMASGEHPFDWKSGFDARREDLVPKRPVMLKRREWQAVRAGLALKRDQRPGDAAAFLKQFSPSTVKATAWIIALLAVVGAFFYSWYFQPQAGPDIPFENLPADLQLEVRTQLDDARAFLDQGDINTALQLFDLALANHSGNLEGVAGMSETVDLALSRISEAVQSGQIDQETHRVTLNQLLEYETLPNDVRERLQAQLQSLQ